MFDPHGRQGRPLSARTLDSHRAQRPTLERLHGCVRAENGRPDVRRQCQPKGGTLYTTNVVHCVPRRGTPYTTSV
eukprot:4101631-Alexandrium_andersonii.AAC.1